MKSSQADRAAARVHFRVHFDDASGQPDHYDVDAASPVQAEALFRAFVADAALDGSKVRVRKIKQVRQ